MAVSFLDFEQPIAELEAKIEELGHVTSDSEVNIDEEIARLRAKSSALTESIFSSLTPWQITQLARHPQRPYTLDYIASMFTDFQELHGDRMYADDMAIVGGLARLEARRSWSSATRRGATPRSGCGATTACPSLRAIASRCGS